MNNIKGKNTVIQKEFADYTVAEFTTSFAIWRENKDGGESVFMGTYGIKDKYAVCSPNLRGMYLPYPTHLRQCETPQEAIEWVIDLCEKELEKHFASVFDFSGTKEVDSNNE